MNGAQLILDSFERNYTDLHHELEDITPAELMAEPYPAIGCESDPISLDTELA